MSLGSTVRSLGAKKVPEKEGAFESIFARLDRSGHHHLSLPCLVNRGCRNYAMQRGCFQPIASQEKRQAVCLLHIYRVTALSTDGKVRSINVHFWSQACGLGIVVFFRFCWVSDIPMLHERSSMWIPFLAS